MTRGGSSSLRHPARQGGYTLVELMVALVAGLSVAMAVVGVSKEATNTFHEEARVSARARMGLRVAMERLRMDLQRAAFMSTGNILGDPLVARSATYTGTLPNLSNMGANIPYSMQTLAGIRLNWGGATIGPGHEANGIERRTASRRTRSTSAATSPRPTSTSPPSSGRRCRAGRRPPARPVPRSLCR